MLSGSPGIPRIWSEFQAVDRRHTLLPRLQTPVGDVSTRRCGWATRGDTSCSALLLELLVRPNARKIYVRARARGLRKPQPAADGDRPAPRRRMAFLLRPGLTVTSSVDPRCKSRIVGSQVVPLDQNSLFLQKGRAKFTQANQIESPSTQFGYAERVLYP